MQKNIFYRNLQYMEENKTIKMTTSWGREVTYIIDEHLNSLKGCILAPEQLERANRQLREIKNFPPELNIKPLER
jgi:hypothetical protein